jgi:uncharacterized protein YbaR (Trm112 family)
VRKFNKFQYYFIILMMSDELLNILACPDCNAGLKRSGKSLQCVKCKRLFKIKSGIPILLPKHQ